MDTAKVGVFVLNRRNNWDAQQRPEPNIDRGLVNKISELVDEGVSNTDEMERRLRGHVLETENITPAPTSKSFFPNRTTIRNHMRKAENIKHTSIDDETNLKGF
ncbi:hypothetical protein DPMN_140057, partial [Dreissena polymorpha]